MVPSTTAVQCGNCGAKNGVDARRVGRIARCRACGHRFILAPKRTLDDSALDWLLDDDDAKTAKKPTPKPEFTSLGAIEKQPTATPRPATR